MDFNKKMSADIQQPPLFLKCKKKELETNPLENQPTSLITDPWESAVSDIRANKPTVRKIDTYLTKFIQHKLIQHMETTI